MKKITNKKLKQIEELCQQSNTIREVYEEYDAKIEKIFNKIIDSNPDSSIEELKKFVGKTYKCESAGKILIFKRLIMMEKERANKA